MQRIQRCNFLFYKEKYKIGNQNIMISFVIFYSHELLSCQSCLYSKFHLHVCAFSSAPQIPFKKYACVVGCVQGHYSILCSYWIGPSYTRAYLFSPVSRQRQLKRTCNNFSQTWYFSWRTNVAIYLSVKVSRIQWLTVIRARHLFIIKYHN